jgi:site-specific recombinase
MPEYSYRVVYLSRTTSRDAARRVLTEHAEHGGWELTRLRRYPDGSRKATLRRQIIRAVRTH